MAEIQKSSSIMIKRPIAEVFAYVTDPRTFRHWQSFVRDAVITSKGPIAVGATYRYCFEVMDHVLETTGVITEYQPFRRYAYESSSGPFPIRGGFTLEEEDGFTKVTISGEADPAGYFSLAKFLIDILLGRQLNITLQTLKEKLEAGPE